MHPDHIATLAILVDIASQQLAQPERHTCPLCGLSVPALGDLASLLFERHLEEHEQ